MTSTSPAAPRKYKAGALLREQIVEAAGRLFGELGFENVSVRRIAQEVGCSQMALYAHFADKQTLLRHICDLLFERYTAHLERDMAVIADPRERLRRACKSFVLIASEHPHHYRMVFLTPASKGSTELRHEISQVSLKYLRVNIKAALPPGSKSALIEARLHQLLGLLHGMTGLLLFSPASYGVKKSAILRELDEACLLILNAPEGKR